MNETKVRGTIINNESGDVLAKDREITLWKGSFLVDNDADVDVNRECQIRLGDGRTADIIINDIRVDPNISAKQITIYFSCFAEDSE